MRENVNHFKLVIRAARLARKLHHPRPGHEYTVQRTVKRAIAITTREMKQEEAFNTLNSMIDRWNGDQSKEKTQ
jgi:hypothetical protein